MKNLEYYTELPSLPFKDYGRNILLLIEKIKNIPEKEQRNYYVQQIIKAMSVVNPQQKDMADYKKKLWHHLFVLANFELDVDCPYDLSEFEKKIDDYPHQKLTYQNQPPRFKQYGKNVEILMNKILELPDDEYKNQQIQALANLMKICAQKTNEEKVEDSTIFQHLSILSNGKLVLTKEEVILQNIPLNKSKASNKKSKKHNRNNKNKKFFFNKNKK